MRLAPALPGNGWGREKPSSSRCEDASVFHLVGAWAGTRSPQPCAPPTASFWPFPCPPGPAQGWDRQLDKIPFSFTSKHTHQWCLVKCRWLRIDGKHIYVVFTSTAGMGRHLQGLLPAPGATGLHRSSGGRQAGQAASKTNSHAGAICSKDCSAQNVAIYLPCFLK